ncbi:MAG: EamA family transporter [Clostridia bacterium]|nr:EamA family transporter [Clostridia bacterium]
MMIGYTFAALALAAALAKAYCSKKSSIFVRDIRENTFSGGIRMLFCIGIGLGFVLAEGGNIFTDAGTIAIALLSGVSGAVHITTWLSATKRGALMLLNIFYLSGVLVPLLLCRFLYDEPIRPIQWAGLAVLMAAVYFMCSYNKSLGGKLTVSSLVILIVCAVTAGLMDFTQKMFLYHDPAGSISVFNFYTYVFSAVTLLGIYGVNKYTDSRRTGTAMTFSGERRLIGEIFVYIVVMAVCMFVNSWCKTKAAVYLTSVQLYPMYQGASLILLSVLSAVFFGEKITVRSAIGIALAFVSLIMMNLL